MTPGLSKSPKIHAFHLPHYIILGEAGGHLPPATHYIGQTSNDEATI